MSPSLSPRCCLPVASHFFFCSPIIFNSSPRCFLPDVVAPLSPSCFPVVFRMSKGCGLPLVSHCPAVVSRFLAVSEMWSPGLPLFTQLSPLFYRYGLPIVSQWSPSLFQICSPTCLRQLPVVSQMGSPNNLSIHVSPSYLRMCSSNCLPCFPWP